jgi:histone chaperone ASF1
VLDDDRLKLFCRLPPFRPESMSLRLVGLQLASANPAPFGNAMEWQLTVEATDALPDPIDVVFSWVADVSDPSKDVELDELEVGPFPVGRHTVTLECDAPELDQLDLDHVLDETCMSVVLKYRDQQFVHVGWPVRVKWADPKHEEEMPDEVKTELLLREVIGKRHTSSSDIDWGLSHKTTGVSDDGDDDDGKKSADAGEDEDDEEEEEEDEDVPESAMKRERDDNAAMSQAKPPQPSAE